MPPVSLIPEANLPPVSLIPVVNLELRISPRIFEKIRNSANVIIRGLGETDSRKKPEAKNLVTVPLSTEKISASTNSVEIFVARYQAQKKLQSTK